MQQNKPLKDQFCLFGIDDSPSPSVNYGAVIGPVRKFRLGRVYEVSFPEFTIDTYIDNLRHWGANISRDVNQMGEILLLPYNFCIGNEVIVHSIDEKPIKDVVVRADKFYFELENENVSFPQPYHADVKREFLRYPTLYSDEFVLAKDAHTRTYVWSESVIVRNNSIIPESIVNQMIDNGERGVRRTIRSWPFGYTLKWDEKVEQESNGHKRVTLSWYWQPTEEK